MTPNFYIVDVETTGLDYSRHEIIDFACLLIKDGKLIDQLSFKIKPERIEDADPKALEVNRYDPMMWTRAISQEEAARRISGFLKDGYIVGHNVNFDRKFISQLLADHRQPHQLPLKRVCTLELCKTMLAQYGLERFRLSDCCDFLHITQQGAHSALGDAFAAWHIWQRLNPRDPYVRFLVHQWLSQKGSAGLPADIICRL